VLQLLVTANIVLGSLIFHIDDWGDIFLRNVGSYKSHMVSQPRRQHASFDSLFEWCKRYVKAARDYWETELCFVFSYFSCGSLWLQFWIPLSHCVEEKSWA
jgi:hypothetical protein